MNARSYARALASALLFSLAACAGGASPSIPPGGASHGGSSMLAKITVLIPRASAAASARSPEFVSASTQSASVAIAPGTGCGTCSSSTTLAAALTPSSPGCASAPNGTQCTISVSLNPGSYVGSMTTYDGPLVSGSPSGNELSGNGSFTFSVTSGQANLVPLTLFGVPHAIGIVPTNTNVETPLTPSTQVYRVANNATTATYAIVATDADHNQIVGPGSPSYSASVNCGGCGAFTASVSGSVLTMTPISNLIYTGAAKSISDVTITATSPMCSVTGAVCSTLVQFGAGKLLVVASSSDVSVWNAGTSGAPVTVKSGAGNITAVAFDPYGNLWVADASANTVSEFVPPFASAQVPATTISGLSHPNALAFDPVTQDLFIAEGYPGDVAIYPAPYTSSSGTITDHIFNPVALSFAQNASFTRLYVLDYGGSTGTGSAVTSYATPYAGTTAVDDVTTGLLSPDGFDVQNDGSFLVANYGNSTVVHYNTPPYASPDVTIASSASAVLSAPSAAVEELNSGNIVTVDPYSKDVNVYGGTGSVKASYASGVIPVVAPQTALADVDGIVWIGDTSAYGLDVTNPVSAMPTIWSSLALPSGSKRLALYP